MRKILNIFVLLPFIIILNNCSSLTLSSFIDYFNYSKTAVDVLSYSTTDKTTTDHALSYMFNKDCSLARTFKLKQICEEINKENLILNNKHLNLKKTKKVYKKRVVKVKKINVPSMGY